MAALRYFFSLLLFPVGFVVAGAGILAFLAGWVSPEQSTLIAFTGLIMPVVLILNLLLVVYWAIKKSRWLIVPLLAILLNTGYLFSIFQFNFSSPRTEVAALKVVSYNVGNFTSWSKQPTRIPIGEYLRDNKTDIACFQEYSESQAIKADSLSRLLALPYYAVETVPGTSSFNSVIFSRYPIISYGHLPFTNTGNDALWADISREDRIVRVINVHLQTTNFNRTRQQLDNPALQNVEIRQIQSVFYPIGKELKTNSEIRAQQADMVRQMIDTSSIPVIVCGDFNDPPSTYTYHRIKGKLQDSFRSRGKGYGYTFRGIHKFLRIDFILYSKQFECIDYESPLLKWSDHKPVISKLTFVIQ